MTNPKLDQARIWADELTRLEGLRPGPRAAIEVIQSLPDHWIDVKEVREVINSQLSNYVQGTVGHSVAEDFACKMQALLSPPLPTLADMTHEERKACQWMQAKIHGSDELVGVIFFLTDDQAKILFRDGTFFTQDHEDITPIPGPKLKWPGSHADTITAESVEDVCNCRDCNSEEGSLPRPEDVPSGKPWIVKFDGHEWVGTRESTVKIVCSWVLARLDGADYTVASDDDITLVSRLVPEVTP